MDKSCPKYDIQKVFSQNHVEVVFGEEKFSFRKIYKIQNETK